jgi:hypothetical protein
VAALSRIRALETSAPPLLDNVAVSAEDLAWNPRRNSSSTELADAVSPVHLLEPAPHRRSQWIPHPRRGGARLEPRPQQAPSQDPASGAGRSSLTPASARPGLPIEASHCPRSGHRRQRLLWLGLCLRLRPREPTREGRQGGERGRAEAPRRVDPDSVRLARSHRCLHLPYTCRSPCPAPAAGVLPASRARPYVATSRI